MQNFWTHVAIRGDNVLLRGIENGRRIKRKIPYRPSLYVPTTTETPFRSIDGRPLGQVEFSSIREARQALTEADFHGYDKFEYVFLHERYPGVSYDPSVVRVCYLDIETSTKGGMPNVATANQPITAITMKVGDQVIALGTGDYTPSDPAVMYVKCEDEVDLLKKFIYLWDSDEYGCDIVTGWNIEMFDIPYIVNRVRAVLGDYWLNRLSPWRAMRERTIVHRGQSTKVLFPVGIAVLDYMTLYHRLAVKTGAADTPDDYKLNTIAHTELGESKLDYSQYDSLLDLYERDHQLFMEYNVKDVLLVERINDRRQLIELVMAMAYNAYCNYEDMLGSVRPWECIAHHQLMNKNIIFPPRKKEVVKQHLVGGFVKDPEPQGFDWVVSCDLNSLYSHLIMQFNISPETRIGHLSEMYTSDKILDGALRTHQDELRERNAIVAANLALYDRSKKGFLPVILEEMYDARVMAKNSKIQATKDYEKTKDPAKKREIAMWGNMDKVHKTNLNAVYGCLTNEYFIFYDHTNAEAITTSGRMAIQWVERKINAWLNNLLGTTDEDFVIAMDTDSVYVHMGPVVDKFCAGKSRDEICDFLDQVCQKKLDLLIEGWYQELAEMVNAVDQKLKMKRENIADRGIWTGKKHYILNVLDSEGVRYENPKIEIKGMAAVKSSTPPACREKIKEAVKLIMTGSESEVIKFISDFRAEFETLPFDQVAFPRSVSKMEDYSSSTTIYKPACPIAVRGALLYNHLLKGYRLTQYPPIYNKDKVRFVYLRIPNPIGENVISTPGPLPKQMKIEEYMDRDTQFEKGFLVPLKTIMDAIGWKTEEVSVLAGLEDLPVIKRQVRDKARYDDPGNSLEGFYE